VPRFDHDPLSRQSLGLLSEVERTNSIRNNTMVGAVAGTPGTLPTNWTGSLNIGAGVSSITSIGSEAGINYIDIRVQGTTPGLGAAVIFINSATAAPSQSWAKSAYTAILSGNVPFGVSMQFGVREHDSGNNFLRQSLFDVNTSSALLTRGTGVLTTGASTAFVVPTLRVGFGTVGIAVDFTLRIGLPQLEQGATVTSVIPTTTIALTRNADVDDMTGSNFSSWYNASEGTLFVEYSAPAVGVRTIFSLNDNSANEAITLRTDGTNPLFTVTDGGSDVANIDAGTVASNVVYKFAGAYAANDFAASINGGAAVTDTSGALPTLDRATIGSLAGSNYLNGHIRRISFYPRRLSNEQLQALTA